jgi:hydroxylamine reductase
MFCRQCEQTKDHYACTTVGVCGKSSETATLQDALLAQIKSVSHWAKAAREAGAAASPAVQTANTWTLQAAFSTLTNVNFSSDRIMEYIVEGENVKDDLKELVPTAPTQPGAALDLRGKTMEELEEFGLTVSIPNRANEMNHVDAFSLNEIATYGSKGMCAYAMHCVQLGVMDEDVLAAVHEIFSKLDDSAPDVDGLLATVMAVGQTNAKVLANLDQAHADLFGAPEPTPVKTTAVEGKCILVSGHDMMDLYELLKQTEGQGINVYTHGEMLPAHGYPKLRAFDHLVGNYGTAWQNQKFEFAAFPGPVVVTTNCVLEPRKMYRDRLYTMNEVGVDGVQHIGPDRDFSGVIEQAKHCKGFPKTFPEEKTLMTGFNHRAVLPLADQVLGAAKSGDLSRIFLIGGCDGSQWDRSYFTELAEATPDDSLILTLGCAKNRVIHSEKLEGKTLANGLPRVLDMGQCNDSYSAIVVATELAKALDCTVNDLPLSLALSHLEQKAAAVLLTLLSMGVKNIRLGPSLPAYVSPNVLDILQKEYNLMGTGEAEHDVAMMMEGK